MKRYTLLLSLFLLCSICAEAQTAKKFTINLTDGGKSHVVCFLPEKPSGKAIVGVPGGGYSVLSNTYEGTDWSNWLNQRGIAYFVVNYRLPNGDRTLPISDVENTFRIVRDSAKAWNINPHDVGVMGFSAGGHLASVVSTQSEFDVRPDFTILFYPVISMDERVSHKWSCINFLGEEGYKNPELVSKYSTQNSVRRHLTPPAVIIMASDDRVVMPVTNGIQYYSAMRNQGNECAMLSIPLATTVLASDLGLNTTTKCSVTLALGSPTVKLPNKVLSKWLAWATVSPTDTASTWPLNTDIPLCYKIVWATVIG